MSLRARLLVVVLVAFVPILGLTLFAAREQRQRAEQDIHIAALQALRAAASEERQIVEKARDLAGSLGSLGVVVHGDASACGTIFADVLARSPEYTALAAATPDGRVFCSASPVLLGSSVAHQRWFQRALETRAYAVGGYAQGHVTARAPSFTIAQPALDPKGAPRAVVFIGLDLLKLSEALSRSRLPPGSVLLVLDAEGLFLARHPDPHGWIGRSAAGTDLGRAVLERSGEGTAEALFLDGVARVFAFASILGTEQSGQVRMLIGIPKAVAYASANRALARNLVGLVLVALLAAALLWVAGDRMLRRPITRLTRAARRVGAGDLDARSGLGGVGGELGQLSRTFDEMAAALRERERALREAEHRLAEARFAWVIEGSPDAIIVADASRRISLFNRGAETIFGYTAAEVLGQPLDFLLPPWAGAAQEEYLRAFAAEPAGARLMGERGEVAGRRKDGSEFPAEASIARVERDGETLLTVILRDITERKATHDALRNITEGVAGATGEAFFRLLAKHLGAAVGARLVLVGELVEAEAERVATLAVCLAGEVVANFDYDLRGTPCEHAATKTLTYVPQGLRDAYPSDPLPVEFGVDAYMCVPLLDSAGKALGLLVIAHSEPFRNEHLAEAMLRTFSLRGAAELERLRSEKALHDSERALEALVETAPGLIVLTDPDGLITRFNRACEELTGYARHEVLGRTIPELFLPPEWIPVVARRFADPYAPEVRAPHENPWRTKSGEERLIEWRCAVLPSPRDGRPCVLGMGTDITERRRTEEQLRQGQRLEAIGRLAGGVAHDFNNLLTVIAGRTQILLGRVGPDDSTRRDLELVRKTADRAAALTRQLLAFSRRQILLPQVLDLNALVANLSAMLERLIGEDIELVFLPGADLGRVKADPGQLEQVVVNLAVNARDAMPAGGRLTLETVNVVLDETYTRAHVGAKPGPHVMLGVSDTGAGIPPEVRERMFEPFFTTKEQGKGTGLGLATVYGVVKQSGGNIWVYSEPGQGTTFKIYLPRVDEPADTLLSADVGDTPMRGTERVLLVEDDPDVRALAREILEERGYTVLEAGHPEEASLIASRHPDAIHLLVTDVVMPRLSGRELARRLVEAHPAMRVLYVSGYTDNAVVHHGVLDAGTPFLQKPFTPEALARKVREVLDAP